MRVTPSASELEAFLRRMTRAVHEGRAEIRGYAREGGRDLGWDAKDIRLQLVELTSGDLRRLEESTAPEGGLVWVFTPDFWDGGYLWIRLIERHGIVVISFHRG